MPFTYQFCMFDIKYTGKASTDLYNLHLAKAPHKQHQWKWTSECVLNTKHFQNYSATNDRRLAKNNRTSEVCTRQKEWTLSCGYLHYFNYVEEMQDLVHFHFSRWFGLLRIVLCWFRFCFGTALSIHWSIVFTISFWLPVIGRFYLRFGLVYNGITEAIQFLGVTEMRAQVHLVAQ